MVSKSTGVCKGRGVEIPGFGTPGFCLLFKGFLHMVVLAVYSYSCLLNHEWSTPSYLLCPVEQ